MLNKHFKNIKIMKISPEVAKIVKSSGKTKHITLSNFDNLVRVCCFILLVSFGFYLLKWVYYGLTYYNCPLLITGTILLLCFALVFVTIKELMNFILMLIIKRYL
jgi:hypothetical protein